MVEPYNAAAKVYAITTGKSDLTEGVEEHVATGAWLGVDVALVEDVTVVQVAHQLQGAADTGALEAGEEREDTRQP